MSGLGVFGVPVLFLFVGTGVNNARQLPLVLRIPG